MPSPKTPSRKKPPATPGGGAFGRARQFTVARGLPPPDIAGAPPAEAPAPPAAKKTKRPAKR
jgi:hypothetical protein